MATSNENLQRQLYLLLIIFGSAALVLALYHIIKVTWYDRRYQMRHIHRPTFFSERGMTPESLEHSMAELIPAHKFQKGVGMIGEDGPCAVCLCDFEEGEEVRTLPECMHSFHVPCIDMWFYSHSTCPICRTDAMPSADASCCVSGDGLGSPPSAHGPRLQPDLGLHSEAV